jgi:hypothetical protein
LYDLDLECLVYLELFELSCVGEQVTCGASSILQVGAFGQLAGVVGDSPLLLFKHGLLSESGGVLASLALVALSLTGIALLKRALLLGHRSLLGVFYTIMLQPDGRPITVALRSIGNMPAIHYFLGVGLR